MNRPNVAILVLFASAITLATFILPPVFPTGEGIERGFPFPWAYQTDLPGNEIPFFGYFVGLFETASLTFSWQYFLVDTALYLAVLLLIFYNMKRKGK